MKLTYTVALLTTGCTFLLLLIGGIVNPTGSSLACPDWPTCYGTFFPTMTGGVLYEHTHRVVASLVGVLTCVLAILIWKNHPGSSRRALRFWGLLAVLTVILQGLLGGITVLYQLPVAVSTAHLGLSILFFLLLVYLCVRLSPAGQKTDGITVGAGFDAARVWVAVALGVVYAQTVLGAFVRHTGAGRVCGTEFPLCFGQFLPSWGPAKLHMMHRWAALLLLAWVTLTTLMVLRANHRLSPPIPSIKKLAITVPHLVALQIILGILTVTSYIGLIQVTAHLGVAVLLLMTLFVLYLKLSPSRE